MQKVNPTPDKVLLSKFIAKIEINATGTSEKMVGITNSLNLKFNLWMKLPNIKYMTFSQCNPSMKVVKQNNMLPVIKRELNPLSLSNDER